LGLKTAIKLSEFNVLISPNNYGHIILRVCKNCTIDITELIMLGGVTGNKTQLAKDRHGYLA
jgi:hypothetical protein